jgi:hypothetical protein
VAEKFIPFRADMLREMKAGRKTMTTRTRRYGEVGDVLRAASAEFSGAGGWMWRESR